MATHIIDLKDTFAMERLSNSMSTQYAFDGRQLTVAWKNNAQTVPCKSGDKVKIVCGGSAPVVQVMTPPSNPLMRVAWQHNYYKGMRWDNLADMAKKSQDVTRYSVGHGCEMPAVALCRSESHNCVIGFMGLSCPWGWWANSNATPEELEDLISRIKRHDYSLTVPWDVLVPEQKALMADLAMKLNWSDVYKRLYCD